LHDDFLHFFACLTLNSRISFFGTINLSALDEDRCSALRPGCLNQVIVNKDNVALLNSYNPVTTELIQVLHIFRFNAPARSDAYSSSVITTHWPFESSM